jgi:hypothetical protein
VLARSQVFDLAGSPGVPGAVVFFGEGRAVLRGLGYWLLRRRRSDQADRADQSNTNDGRNTRFKATPQELTGWIDRRAQWSFMPTYTPKRRLFNQKN